MNKITLHPAFVFTRSHDGIFEFKHKKNKLRVLFHQLSGTGVVTSNIVYCVGSKHELPGHTGLAHMLEHMLFKPSKTDLAHKRQSSIMALERNIGVTINASTWKDRTNYFCTAPASYLREILTIQADQMQNILINKKNLTAEQTAVLSEYDMYNSDPHFALECAVSAVAFSAHPYRHETIGWRSDIERFTADALNDFYRTHYIPNNATIIIVGDTTCNEALSAVDDAFGKIPFGTPSTNSIIIEPPQEGIRRTSVVRPTTTNLLSIATKASAFGTIEWLQTLILLKILADGPDSILHRALVDTGKVTGVDYSIYPTAEPFLATIVCTLANNSSHDSIEQTILTIISNLTVKDLQKALKKTVAQICYAEPHSRDSSNSIASELTEYVATDDWTTWCKLEALVKKVTPKELVTLRDHLFTSTKLTIGTFKGTTE